MENLPAKLESYLPTITNWKLQVVFPQSHSVHLQECGVPFKVNGFLKQNSIN